MNYCIRLVVLATCSLLASSMARTEQFNRHTPGPHGLTGIPEIVARTNDMVGCDKSGSCRSVAIHEQEARDYLMQTARPGLTMSRQGPSVAIDRLHPEFVLRIASAIREARAAGLSDAGIFSAYRPPAFGVGGFDDRFNSLHSYGLAVDMYGIGRPGSAEAKLWHEIAAKHGIACPYGHNNRKEWNHCQPTRLKIVREQNPLRETITAEGPINLERMFAVGTSLIADLTSAAAFLTANAAEYRDGSNSSRNVSLKTKSTVKQRRVQITENRLVRQSSKYDRSRLRNRNRHDRSMPSPTTMVYVPERHPRTAAHKATKQRRSHVSKSGIRSLSAGRPAESSSMHKNRSAQSGRLAKTE